MTIDRTEAVREHLANTTSSTCSIATGLRFAARHFTLVKMTHIDFEMTDALLDLLVNVEKRAGVDFSGTGVIVSERVDDLPILAMRTSSNLGGFADAADLLATISNPAHEHHDGFHVLGPDLQILRLGQYFSPPIVHSVRIDRSKRFGGRYLAALFGSMLPGVIATGIASCDFGVAVFRNGQEIAHRRSQLTEAIIDKHTT